MADAHCNNAEGSDGLRHEVVLATKTILQSLTPSWQVILLFQENSQLDNGFVLQLEKLLQNRWHSHRQ
ncbi:hypothetical protein TNIN_436501 [Trichonephila inaurata madagascariensis]|uniref:Uncharacterized protein n=1 Tax=Trichonephila inaurata madagascariensis TaxID=2747483 RepID=A0A8X6Y462_9ARAC|nr:hypothetical protein TNIN_436501 [Trichonephila inaurata madagascariensis]